MQISSETIVVNGCHPSISKSYHLCSGITAIDLPDGTLLIGQHEVPLIPNADIMLLSETQARCHGIDIDSKPKIFGGRSSIIVDDDTELPIESTPHSNSSDERCPLGARRWKSSEVDGRDGSRLPV